MRLYVRKTQEKSLNIMRVQPCCCSGVKLGVCCCTQSMFEAPRHHGVVPAEDTQSVAVRVFQQQAQTEAMVPLVQGGYR